MRLKFLFVPVIALMAAVPLSGCDTIAAFTSNLATSLSSSTPSQVTTLSEAINAADLVTRAATFAVNTGTLDAGTLHEIDALSDGVHAGLTDLEAANAQGKSLSYASFNAALQAFNAFMTSHSLEH